jgi:NADH:ubiquinone oxidoreductase subunit F (NADH-binding)
VSQRAGSPCLPPQTSTAWPRLLPGNAADGTESANLRGHLSRHGARPSCSGDWQRRQQLIDEVERAHLTGRGGAAFPAAVKLRALATAPRTPVVIANGVEGEPASAKDKVLLMARCLRPS